jgi:hypothetical protein
VSGYSFSRHHQVSLQARSELRESRLAHCDQLCFGKKMQFETIPCGPGAAAQHSPIATSCIVVAFIGVETTFPNVSGFLRRLAPAIVYPTEISFLILPARASGVGPLSFIKPTAVLHSASVGSHSLPDRQSDFRFVLFRSAICKTPGYRTSLNSVRFEKDNFATRQTI